MKRRVVKFALLSLLTLIACNALSLLLENGNTERPALTIFSLVHASCFSSVVVILSSVLILDRVFVLKQKASCHQFNSVYLSVFG
jgi:hypothetical protein